jgi:hypothetical protein
MKSRRNYFKAISVHSNTKLSQQLASASKQAQNLKDSTYSMYHIFIEKNNQILVISTP